MKKHRIKFKPGLKPSLLVVVAVAAFCWLLFYHLGSLTRGVSSVEVQASTMAVGWHGIYHSPLYLPLKLLRSVDFYFFKAHGQSLTRLPNTIFGGLSILGFIYLVYLWHGKRTALLAGSLFATAAWVLHVSRLASFDVLYLFGTVALLLIQALFTRKQAVHKSVWYIAMATYGLLLSIPGLIWLVATAMVLQRQHLRANLKRYCSAWWQKLLSVILIVIWLPLVGRALFRHHYIKLYLGLPEHAPRLVELVKHFAAVFIHLFFRGPQYNNVWLGKAPLLDVFTLAMALVGVYVYARHWRNARSRAVAALFLVSVILVSLGGAVSFSLVVPFAYLMAAMGVTYLMHTWLTVFPKNPLARSFGIGLITFVVALSCLYNLRAYFVAWPNNLTTRSTFSHRLR